MKDASVSPPWRGQGGDSKQFNFLKPCGAFSCGASLSCNSSQGGPLAANSNASTIPWFHVPVQ